MRTLILALLLGCLISALTSRLLYLYIRATEQDGQVTRGKKR